MTKEKVHPLKIESIASGGGQNDEFPTEANDLADYQDIKGIVFSGDDNKSIDTDGSGNIQFQDLIETVAITVRQLRTASYNLFSNISNFFRASNVQTALEEAKYESLSKNNIELSNVIPEKEQLIVVGTLKILGTSTLTVSGRAAIL